jgi:ribosomal protein S27AE
MDSEFLCTALQGAKRLMDSCCNSQVLLRSHFHSRFTCGKC